jgi:hypothetical protein
MIHPRLRPSPAFVSALLLAFCVVMIAHSADAAPDPSSRVIDACCLGHHHTDVTESRSAKKEESGINAAGLRLTDWGASHTSCPCCLAACCRHGMPLAIPAIANAGSQSSRPASDHSSTSIDETRPWSRVSRSCWPRQVDRLSDSGSSVALHLRLRVMII